MLWRIYYWVLRRLGHDIKAAWWLKTHTKQRLKAGRRPAILLGDSHAALAPESELFDNLGVPGDTVRDIEWRVRHGALELKRGRAVFLIAGANDVFAGKRAATVAADILTLADSISRDGRDVVVCTIPATEGNRLANATIAEINELLARMLRPDEILITPAVDYTDGVHLGRESYQAFINTIRGHLIKGVNYD